MERDPEMEETVKVTDLVIYAPRDDWLASAYGDDDASSDDDAWIHGNLEHI